MPEGDIISYLLTGQPMSASRSQTNLLMTAAGALVPQGKSRSMLKQLGVDTFYISSDYESGSGEDSTTVVTTGKYLNPDLYLSFGYSPDGGNDRVKLRYRLTPTWDIESTLGHDSGADLFYRIEFD
jgi:translocation and assembly module TamB